MGFRAESAGWSWPIVKLSVWPSCSPVLFCLPSISLCKLCLNAKFPDQFFSFNLSPHPFVPGAPYLRLRRGLNFTVFLHTPSAASVRVCAQANGDVPLWYVHEGKQKKNQACFQPKIMILDTSLKSHPDCAQVLVCSLSLFRILPFSATSLAVRDAVIQLLSLCSPLLCVQVTWPVRRGGRRGVKVSSNTLLIRPNWKPDGNFTPPPIPICVSLSFPCLFSSP